MRVLHFVPAWGKNNTSLLYFVGFSIWDIPVNVIFAWYFILQVLFYLFKACTWWNYLHMLVLQSSLYSQSTIRPMLLVVRYHNKVLISAFNEIMECSSKYTIIYCGSVSTTLFMWMCVRMYAERVYACLYVRVFGYVHAECVCMAVCMMCVCMFMYVCMYVCIYVLLYVWCTFLESWSTYVYKQYVYMYVICGNKYLGH